MCTCLPFLPNLSKPPPNSISTPCSLDEMSWGAVAIVMPGGLVDARGKKTGGGDYYPSTFHPMVRWGQTVAGDIKYYQMDKTMVQDFMRESYTRADRQIRELLRYAPTSCPVAVLQRIRKQWNSEDWLPRLRWGSTVREKYDEDSYQRLLDWMEEFPYLYGLEVAPARPSYTVIAPEVLPKNFITWNEDGSHN